MRSISSRFETAKEAMSPSDALLSSEMMPWVRVLVLLAVAAAQPLARFLSAVSSLLLGEESTAFGWLTAPNLILVISSHGAELTTASMKSWRGVLPLPLGHGVEGRLEGLGAVLLLACVLAGSHEAVDEPLDDG